MGKLTENYGELITGAMRAVAQMHSDTSRLLIDCDKHIARGRGSIFGNYATRDLTYNVRAAQWMADGVFRYYLAGSRNVEGVTVAFREDGATEPIFMIAQINYTGPATDVASDEQMAAVKSVCREWDIWHLFFNGSREMNKVIEYKDAEKGRIESARLIAVPLYSIRAIEDVIELGNRLCAGEQGAASVAAMA
jgi:hypothetical protein